MFHTLLALKHLIVMHPAYIHQCINTYMGSGGERDSSPSLTLPGNTHVMYFTCQVLLIKFFSYSTCITPLLAIIATTRMGSTSWNLSMNNGTGLTGTAPRNILGTGSRRRMPLTKATMALGIQIWNPLHLLKKSLTELPKHDSMQSLLAPRLVSKNPHKEVKMTLGIETQNRPNNLQLCWKAIQSSKILLRQLNQVGHDRTICLLMSHHLGVTTTWSPIVQLKLSRIYSLASIIHQDCFYGFRLGVTLALVSVIEQERKVLWVGAKRNSDCN